MRIDLSFFSIAGRMIAKSFGEFFELAYLFFKVKGYLLREERRCKRKFAHLYAFQQADRALRASYRFINPYSLSKRFLRDQGAHDLDLYGETPLTTLDQIAEECGINSADRVIELGCGRGRGALFLRYRFECEVVGIEWIPLFVSKAKKIAALDPDKKVTFECSDFFQADICFATVIYLYGTCLEEHQIKLLASRLAKRGPKVRIITVSYPLSDYSAAFETKKSFSAFFPWGEAEIFLNQALEPIPVKSFGLFS